MTTQTEIGNRRLEQTEKDINGRTWYVARMYRKTPKAKYHAEKCEWAYRFRTEEERAEYVTKQIGYLKAEAERKATQPRRKSSQAQCAAAIRTELKTVFPDVKFSVTSEGFSMGDAVRIQWTDGPETKAVEKITDKYQYGRFDGMTDMYEQTNMREDIPQSKWVTCSRRKSQIEQVA